MRRIFWLTVPVLTLTVALFTGRGSKAGEPPGEHPGKEAKAKPEQVKEAILGYIHSDTELKGGYFLIWDDAEQRIWKLDFSKPHEKVMVLEDGTYFMCTDFRSQEKQPDGSMKTATLDIDFWLEGGKDGKLTVDRIKIHKVGGMPRFKYEADKMKPVEG